MKNSNDTFGNRTCDLPTCKVVPQPTALPRQQTLTKYRSIFNHLHGVVFQNISIFTNIALRISSLLQLQYFETTVTNENFIYHPKLIRGILVNFSVQIYAKMSSVLPDTTLISFLIVIYSQNKEERSKCL
jgi:hypothetical protein